MMETSEIFAALKTEKSTRESFEGVYPLDKIPLRQDLDYNEEGECFLVVNLDPSYKSGSHWVVLYINAVDRCNEYFDSYGLQPPKEISLKLGSFLQTRIELQSPTSTTCGQWCIIYIWHRCNGFTLPLFVEKFKKLENADKKVNELVNECFMGKKKYVVCSQKFWVRQISKAAAEAGAAST